MKKILSLVVCICLLIGCSTIAASAANLGWAWPVPASNSISSCFTDGRNHNAIDISAPKGSSVISAYAGKVIATNTTCSHNYGKNSSCGCGGDLGNYIYILSSFNGQDYVSRYGHLSTVNVSVGQNVSKGQAIGTVGSTGYSTGFHLDYQIYIPTSGNNFNASRFVDPLMDGFLEVPAGLNANASSTSCCDEYVYKVLNGNISIINFNPCGGTCSTSFIVRKFGQLYGDLPVPVRDGYIFDGWYSERNGKGAKYTSDMKYWGKNETVTWYANWKIDGSIINFDPCGGTCSTSFIVKKFGELYGTLPTPKRDGYIFDGWYSEKNGKGTKYTSDMKYWGKNEIVTWYANWIQNSPDIDLPHSVLFPKTNTYTQGQFTDVPASQWFTGNVAAAVEFGLMKGNSVSTFNPYGDVTLAEAITMAARIHSIYTTGDESFVQASGNAWYQVYLDYAYQNGIIDLSYYGADVQKKATRAQYAEIFANALPDEALSSQNDVPDNAIPDVSVSAPYAPAVYKLYRAGILAGGDANGTFSPLTYITRAESATIVARMADSDNRMSFSL